MNNPNRPDQPNQPNQKTRRDFLTLLIQGGLFMTFISMVLPAVAYLLPITRRGPTSGLEEVGKEEDFPLWGHKKVEVNGSPVLVIRTPKEIKAFSAICTHLGCVVGWDSAKKLIACPCHAGFFNLEGNVVSGPPPKPLPIYEVVASDGKVFVKF
ncbi:MAG: ubiquinol-cytochrome c reductase iron-sulfur subunit [Candidatus Omnitrophica bacterium]|nr:ubiquinol-cytochrome c reductase iron-sulfur subunit [Candidatus Omnitrophota bacterium]